MAEAAVETPSQNRFFCHSCSTEISPKPDYTCPQCDNGFIEEITEEFTEQEPPPEQEREIDPAAQFAELWGRTFLENFQNQVTGQGTNTSGISFGRGSGRHDDSDSDDDDRNHPPPHGLRPSLIRPNSRPIGRISVRTVNRRPPVRTPQLHGLLQMFVERLTGEMGQQPMNFFPIHGNPADYAWGVGGLDNIITQLLNQLESSGPAPADKSKIESIPMVKISQKQVDDVYQCSICMEDFSLDEEVKKLPCDHHYHKDCIVTWLKMHGTCPVCRKDLNGVDSSLKDDYPTPTDLMDSHISSRQDSDITRSDETDD